mgnify:FL=1
MSRTALFRLGVLLGLAIALSSVREFCFHNLNYQLSFAAGQTDRSYAHSLVRHQLEGWGLPALLRLKWMLALGFVALMGLLTFLTGRALFGKRLDRVILLGYLLMGAAALLLHVSAHWLPFTASAGVKLLHVLQYPMPLVFLIIASFLPGQGDVSRH